MGCDSDSTETVAQTDPPKSVEPQKSSPDSEKQNLSDQPKLPLTPIQKIRSMGGEVKLYPESDLLTRSE